MKKVEDLEKYYNEVIMLEKIRKYLVCEIGNKDLCQNAKEYSGILLS